MVFWRLYLKTTMVASAYVGIGNFYNLQKRAQTNLKTTLAIGIYALCKGMIYGVTWPILPISLVKRNDEIMGSDVTLAVENNRLTLIERV